MLASVIDHLPKRSLIALVSFLIHRHQNVVGILIDDGDYAVLVLPHPHTLLHNLLHLRQKALLAVAYHVFTLVTVNVDPLFALFDLKKLPFYT